MLMTETAIPELVAISYHSSKLCDAFTSVTSITWFAQKLEETGFITRQASSNVLGTTGCGDQEKCFRLLDAVKVQVGAKRDMFKSFVDILNSEAALSIYAEMVFNSYGKINLSAHDVHHQRCCSYMWPQRPVKNRYEILVATSFKTSVITCPFMANVTQSEP